MKTKFCELCGIEFTPKNRWGKHFKNTRFCSKKCSNYVTGQGNCTTVESKLWPRLKISDSGCWEWQGGKDKDGYGSLRWGKEQRSHRVAWILSFGPIPNGLQVLHHCDNPPCCNPIHLFTGTSDDNNKDMIRKGRSNPPRGERAGTAKLTTQDVLEIRRLHSEGIVQRKIAEMFAVGFKAINKIVLRQRWKHI